MTQKPRTSIKIQVITLFATSVLVYAWGFLTEDPKLVGAAIAFSSSAFWVAIWNRNAAKVTQ